MANPQKLSAFTQFAFSLQAGVSAAMLIVTAVFLPKFYIDVLLLPAGVLAIALVVGRAFDAVTDPLMGWLTDNTESRWGRRMPWIFAGVIGNALMFYVLLNPIPQLTAESSVLVNCTALVLVFLFLTMTSVPRQALAAEITHDQLERQSLFGGIAGFIALGMVIGSIVPNILESQGITAPLDKMHWQSVIYVTAYLAANALFFWKVRERREYIGRGNVPIVPGIRRALQNKPFRILFVSHIITAIPIAMPTTLLPFFVEYVLKADAIWVGYLLFMYLIAGLLALPIWVMLAETKGKKVVWLSAGSLAVLGGLALLTLGEGDSRNALFLYFIVGAQSSVWWFVGGAMHADVIDYDELRTGKRREAQFTAMWAFVPKFALIPGAAIPLAVLGMIGYVPNAEQQTETVLSGLRIMYALVPAILNGIGLAIIYWYPLTEQKQKEIRLAIAEQEAGNSVVDPLTGERLAPAAERDENSAAAWRLDHLSFNELIAIANNGKTRVVGTIMLQIVAAIALSIASVRFAWASIDSLTSEPGLMPTLAILLSGVALSVALFHGLKLRVALRLSAKEVLSDGRMQ